MALEKTIAEIMDQMSLREKVGQMLVATFRIWQDPKNLGDSAEVTELNDEIRKCIQKNHFGGTILFSEHFKNAGQALRLAMDFQSTNQKSGGLPMFIAVDQEGGNTARIGFGTTGVGNMALAATGNVENARQMARVYGEELQALGLNMDYAPVLDVNNNPKNPIIGVRSFSDSPEVVRDYGVAYMEGLHSTGTIATLKHFPGHGDTNKDSHKAFPCINKTYEELKALELIPFEVAIKNGADMIMTAHIQYPKIEKETYVSTTTGEKVTLPATMSHTILTDVLRGNLGFEGVVVTDALDMKAITDNFDWEDVLCKTISGGADMLMLPLIYSVRDFEQTDGAVDLVIKLIEDGRIERARIDESVRRILTLKEKYGILSENDYTVTEEKLKKAEVTVGNKANRETAWKIAMQALTLVKNDGMVYPIQRDAGDETLILFAESSASAVGYGKLARKLLRDDGITVMVYEKGNQNECLLAAKRAAHVILIHGANGEACFHPETEEGFSSGGFDEIIKMRHAAGQQVIMISSMLPYDAARFTDADAILLAYCSDAMKTIPNETGEGSAYSPNLLAAIISCFGTEEVHGKLPVDIPALDEDFKMTDQVWLERENKK